MAGGWNGYGEDVFLDSEGGDDDKEVDWAQERGGSIGVGTGQIPIPFMA